MIPAECYLLSRTLSSVCCSFLPGGTAFWMTFCKLHRDQIVLEMMPGLVYICLLCSVKIIAGLHVTVNMSVFFVFVIFLFVRMNYICYNSNKNAGHCSLSCFGINKL